jgi:hypothetical protein
VWGAAGAADTIVWGTVVGRDGFNIVWGTADPVEDVIWSVPSARRRPHLAPVVDPALR